MLISPSWCCPLVCCALIASFMPHPPICSPCPLLLFFLGKWRTDRGMGVSLGRCLASFLSTIDLKRAIMWITCIQTPVRFLLTILMELLPFYCMASKVRITFLCNSRYQHSPDNTIHVAFKNAEVIKIQVKYLQHLMGCVYLFLRDSFLLKRMKEKSEEGKGTKSLLQSVETKRRKKQNVCRK